MGATYPDGGNYPEHVYFLDGKAHVHEMYLDTVWHDQDLTAATNAPVTAGQTSQLVSFYASQAYPQGGVYPEHVFYQDGNRDLHEMVLDGTMEWHDENLTTGYRLPSIGNPTGFYTPTDDPEYILGLGTGAYDQFYLNGVASVWSAVQFN